jgi:hypothetical protein
MGLMDELDNMEMGGRPDLVRFKPEDGKNRLRILSKGIPYGCHWSFPDGSERRASLPCLQDPRKDAPKVKCPFCELNAKNPKFFERKVGLAFAVVHEGVVKMAEFEQKGVLNGLGKLESDDDWAAIVKGDLSNVEVIIDKIDTNGKISYAVGWAPGSGPLEAAKLEEYRAQAPNIERMKKAPDLSTEEGVARLADLCSKVVMTVPPLTEEEKAILASGKKLQAARK